MQWESMMSEDEILRGLRAIADDLDRNHRPGRPGVAPRMRPRSRIPLWALPVLLALPLWAYVYQATLEPPPGADDAPIALGEEVYATCASCHRLDGTGSGTAPALDEVLRTWPDYRDHMMWVRLGDPGWPGEVYGATDRPKTTGMPPYTMSNAQLAQVVLYERVTFGGLDELSEEAKALESLARGDAQFQDVGLGPVSVEHGVDSRHLDEP